MIHRPPTWTAFLASHNEQQKLAMDTRQRGAVVIKSVSIVAFSLLDYNLFSYRTNGAMFHG